MAKLFGSSGVRGLANIDLTPLLACKVGLAVAAYAKAKKAVVARDTRVSGDMLEDALVSGLLSSGTDVYLAWHSSDTHFSLRHKSVRGGRRIHAYCFA